MHSVRVLRMREAQTRAASALLRRIVLWPGVELDARTGSSHVVGFSADVARLAPSLYAIALRDTATGAIVLTTAVYAPAKADVAR
jgi:hypothetical protein